MAKIKLLQDFFKNGLTENESNEVKGGRNYVPTNSGSYGYINWDDIDIRQEGLVLNTDTPASLNISKTVLGFTGK